MNNITTTNSVNKAKTTVVKRESNFELLRIVAMLAIVFCHISMSLQLTGTFVDYVLTFMVSFGTFGVAIFLLISGYWLFAKLSG
jgi:peptidoglycan/LPS O-acetylase OafA/YrhL